MWVCSKPQFFLKNSKSRCLSSLLSAFLGYVHLMGDEGKHVKRRNKIWVSIFEIKDVNDQQVIDKYPDYEMKLCSPFELAHD